jgi:hypothetical protein
MGWPLTVMTAGEAAPGVGAGTKAVLPPTTTARLAGATPASVGCGLTGDGEGGLF